VAAGCPQVQFRFADYLLDLARRELRRGGELVALEPQVFDLLTHLIRNRDRVVTKNDLLDSVWGGRIVSESTLTSRINAARKAVGDNGEAQCLIRTVPRRGIRFIGEVTAALAVEAPPLPVLHERPSIAVLAFDNLRLCAAITASVVMPCLNPSWWPQGHHPRLCLRPALQGVDGGPAPATTWRGR